MLSIGKLAGGQADYYLEQAHGYVTRAQSIGSGVEDYYLGGPEARGTWMGSAARLLSVDGEVGDDALRRVLECAHPGTGELLARCAPDRVPGFDLTFSAPKS